MRQTGPVLMFALLVATLPDPGGAAKAASASWIDCVHAAAKPGMDAVTPPDDVAEAALAACKPALERFEREALLAHRLVGHDEPTALARSALLVEESRASLKQRVATMVRAYRRVAPSLPE